MSNPVTPFRNNLFASRPTIQEALDYAEMLINTLSNVDQVAVRTAFGVVLNTIDSTVTQFQVPSPEMDQADMLTQLGGMYDKLVNDVVAKVSARDIALIDERIAEHKLIREDAIGNVVDEHIDNLVDDKKVDMEKSGKNEYVLTSDDVENFSPNEIKKTFNIFDEEEENIKESYKRRRRFL